MAAQDPLDPTISTPRLWLLAALALGFALASAWLHWNHSGLNYDEGDYYQAAAKGFVTNWTDADEISIIEFVSQGIKAVRGEISRGELSRQGRERRSAAFLRHYHSPLALYPAIAVRAIAPDMQKEMQLRTANVIWMTLWLLALAMIMMMHPQTRSPWFILLPASASWGASLVGFNMHIPFALSTATFFYLWHRHEQSDAQSSLKRTALFFLAFAIFSVEYSLFLIGALVTWGAREFWTTASTERRRLLRRRGIDAAWLLGFLLLLWPAGIIQGGLLKAYAVQSFIALFRLAELPSSFGSLWQMLVMKWNPSPLELVIAASVIIAFVWRWRQVWRRGALFVSLLLLAAIVYTQLNPVLNLPWYLFPLFAIVYVLYADVVADRIESLRRHAVVVAVVMAAVLFGVAQTVLRTGYDPQMLQLRDAVAALPAQHIITAQPLAPQFSAYLPDRSVRGILVDEMRSRTMQDSLELWSRDHVVVVPREITLGSRKAFRTEYYTVYWGQE